MATWIGPNPTFQAQMWNHWDEVHRGVRTTNHLEGFHSRLNDKVSTAHPNLFHAIEVLKKEENRVSTSIIRLEAGENVAPPTKRKYRNIQQRLDRLKTRFINGFLNIEQYAQSVSHLLN